MVGEDTKLAKKIIWLVIDNYKIILSSSIFLCLLFFAKAAFLSPKVFLTETKITSNFTDQSGFSSLLGQFGSLSSIAGVSLTDESRKKKEALAVFESRKFIINFILQNQYSKNLFPERWDENSGSWIKQSIWLAHYKSLVYGLSVSAEPTEGEIYNRFMKKYFSLSESVDGSSYVVGVKTNDKSFGLEISRRIISYINEEMRLRFENEARSSIEMLRRELKSQNSAEIIKVGYELIEGQERNILVAKSRNEFAFKVVDPPMTLDGYYTPNVVFQAVFGFFLGLFLSFGYFVIAKDFLHEFF